jgi:hypothetical protein
MTEAGNGACTGDSALCYSDIPSCSIRGAAAATVHICDFGTPTAAIALCVPGAETASASPGTSNADTVSTVFWRFCGGLCLGTLWVSSPVFDDRLTELSTCCKDVGGGGGGGSWWCASCSC